MAKIGEKKFFYLNEHVLNYSALGSDMGFSLFDAGLWKSRKNLKENH